MLKQCNTLGIAAALSLLPIEVGAVDRIDVSHAPYYAACDGVADDTTAIKAAVADALAARVPLYIPAGGGCRYSDTIILTKMIPIVGESRSVSRLLYCGTDDAIRIEPPVDRSDNIGHLIRDIGILPCKQSGGDNGIEVRLGLGSFYAYYDIERISIGDFGGYGVWLNNGADNRDGFFNGRLANSLILNGIKGDSIGDSLTFDRVVIHGKNNVSLTGVPGARLTSFIGGQITTTSGFLILNGVNGFRARDVWMEHPSYKGDPPSADMSGVTVINSTDVIIDGATINVHQGPTNKFSHVIALAGASDTKIINTAFVNSGSATHIYGTDTTIRTRVEGNNYSGQAAKVVLQGS